MRIHLTSLFVADQDKALAFYTDVLGFVMKHDVPMGKFRWLTVVSPEDVDGTELVLEPDESSIAHNYNTALVAAGIPAAAFAVDDVHADFHRLSELGVRFTQEPVEMDTVDFAILDDTCGNLIQIVRNKL